MKSIIKALTIIKKQKTSKRVKLYFNKREHDVVAFWIEKFTYLSKYQVYKLISLWYWPFILAYKEKIHSIDKKINKELIVRMKKTPTFVVMSYIDSIF